MWGTVAQCVALLPHSKKVVGSSPTWCNMSGLVPGPFCVEFACSPRVHPGSPHRTPQQQKHAKRTDAHPVPDQDRAPGTGHLDLVPGRRIAGSPLLLAFPWGRTPGWEKCREHFPPSSHLHVCVCVTTHCVCNVCACCVALKRTCPVLLIWYTDIHVCARAYA